MWYGGWFPILKTYSCIEISSSKFKASSWKITSTAAIISLRLIKPHDSHRHDLTPPNYYQTHIKQSLLHDGAKNFEANIKSLILKKAIVCFFRLLGRLNWYQGYFIVRRCNVIAGEMLLSMTTLWQHALETWGTGVCAPQVRNSFWRLGAAVIFSRDDSQDGKFRYKMMFLL